MRKILSVLLVLLLSCFGFFDVFAGIFSSNSKPPYCAGEEECSLEKGAEITKGQIKDIYSDSDGAASHIQDIIAYVLTFLYLLAVIIIIYAGYRILTAGGNEDQITTSKKIILYTIIGVAIIFLAGPITKFILEMFKYSPKN